MLNTGDHNRHKTTNAMLIWVWPPRSVALGPAAAKSQLGMGCNLKVIKSCCRLQNVSSAGNYSFVITLHRAWLGGVPNTVEAALLQTEKPYLQTKLHVSYYFVTNFALYLDDFTLYPKCPICRNAIGARHEWKYWGGRNSACVLCWVSSCPGPAKCVWLLQNWHEINHKQLWNIIEIVIMPSARGSAQPRCCKISPIFPLWAASGRKVAPTVEFQQRYER